MVYRFGDFALDHDIRQLFLGRTEVHLSPKAFELLTVLLAHRARAVSKAELQQHLWPSTFVEETNLAGLVGEIRRALRDSASSPSFVRTVYGFGYRFVGDVTVESSPRRPERRAHDCASWSAAREMLLMEGANVIGREPDATIQLDARGVSRHHARILVSGGSAILEDLESKNGTVREWTPHHRADSPVRRRCHRTWDRQPDIPHRTVDQSNRDGLIRSALVVVAAR